MEYDDLNFNLNLTGFFFFHYFLGRVSLTKRAEKESVDIFVMNLYRLLLTPPLRGKNVISLDPGFSHGCKLAVLGSTGE